VPVVRPRARALAAEASAAHLRERRSDRDFCAHALRSLEKRKATAPPDRAALLAARIASTREERDRRMAEIDEKVSGRHDVRPFRLHVLPVPGCGCRSTCARAAPLPEPSGFRS